MSEEANLAALTNETILSLLDTITQLRKENEELREALEMILASHEVSGPCASQAFTALAQLSRNEGELK